MAPTERVPVQLADGETYHLRFTNRALVTLEEATGLTLTQAEHRMGIGSMRVTSALLWAGLLHASPELKRDAVIDLIDLQRLEEIAGAIGKALAAAFGVEEEVADTAAEEGKNEGNGQAVA